MTQHDLRMTENHDGVPARRRLRAVAVLPTLITLGNLLCGFGAIYWCMQAAGPGHSESAGRLLERWLPSTLSLGAYLVYLAMFLDTLDGRLARMVGTTSDFGGQLDSLADTVSFGVAPAMLMVTMLERSTTFSILSHSWIAAVFGDSLGRGIWLAGAVYVACVAVRLARFNVEVLIDKSASGNFRGMPSPGGAASLVSLVLLHEHLAVTWGTPAWFVGVIPAFSIVLGLLMVSRIPYIHFANVFLRRRQPLPLVGLAFAAVLCVLWQPEFSLVAIANAYVFAGPVLGIQRRLAAKSTRHGHAPPDAHTDAAERTG